MSQTLPPLRAALPCALLALTLSLAGCGSGPTADAAAVPAPTSTITTVAVVPPPEATAAPSSTTAEEANASPPEASATPSNDLAALSDEFDQADSLQAWQDHAAVEGWPNWIEQVDVNTTSAGHLYLVPATSGWFRDDRGVFLFKTVTGDFDVTTRILATGKAQELPSRTYSLSGLMVRAPRDVTADTWTPGGENWLFITTGYGDERPGNLAGKPQIETKTTRNSESDLTLRVVPPGWIDLRVVRVGANFLMLYRSEGKPWQISRRFIRPDLPATLQVGLNAYSADMSVRGPQDMRDTTPTSGDLVVRSEYVRFQRPHMEADLRARAAEGELTNAEWKTWVESLPDAAPAHE